jgi:EmrB/QacA subfamily drug resistance transporter
LLVLIGLITAVGRFADMVGRKLLYIYGFLVFIASSALCGTASSLGALNAYRVLQGVGAAMIQANSVAIIVLAVPKARLGRAIGVQGAAQAMGLALGPTLGGLLIALGGWRLIFYVNIPVGLLGTALAWFLIPRSRHLHPKTAFDWAGLTLFFPAVAALLSALSFGDRAGWTSPEIESLFCAATALGSAFIWRERRARTPMLDLSLFRRVPFSAGISSGLLSYLLLFGVLFVVPFYLERGLGQSAGRAGLELAAAPIALGLTAPFAGRLAERIGARSLTVTGMAVAAMAMGLQVIMHGSVWQVEIELALVGMGLGLFTPPNNAAIMGSVPRHHSGVASGVLNTTRGLGTAMGLAFAGLIFGLVAGSEKASVPSVTRGFVVCAVFLGVVALAAMALAALRGQGDLRFDPLSRTE